MSDDEASLDGIAVSLPTCLSAKGGRHAEGNR